MFASMRTRALLACGLGLGLSALTVAPSGATGPAPTPALPTLVPTQALYDVGVPQSLTAAESEAAAAGSGSLKTFRSTVTDSGKKYTYSMVGTNPAVKGGSPTTTIKTLLVPLDIVLPNGHHYDPTAVDSCDPGASALARAQKSPIFVGRPWVFGGTSIGSGQYEDAFQRANFYKFTKPAGVNPGFSVQLGLTTLAKVTVKVPAAFAAEGTAGSSCGIGRFGGVQIQWLDGYLQKTVIPSLAAQGVNASTFPLFVVHNVVEYITSTSNCCVLGYHNAYSHAGVQTYGLTDYDNSNTFSGSSDVATLSHEAGEWMDDPFTTNPTRPWGHIGQVTGCQSNLEVGDPLSGNVFTVKSGTFTYHLQELAFFSWFYRQVPSLGVNGWYSDQGSFRNFQAATCH